MIELAHPANQALLLLVDGSSGIDSSTSSSPGISSSSPGGSIDSPGGSIGIDSSINPGVSSSIISSQQILG